MNWWHGDEDGSSSDKANFPWRLPSICDAGLRILAGIRVNDIMANESIHSFVIPDENSNGIRSKVIGGSVCSFNNTDLPFSPGDRITNPPHP
jgi:hypothetical protein